MCVENKMTNNGPMWAPHELKFQYRTHIGPFGHYVRIFPIWDPFGHACWIGTAEIYLLNALMYND